MKYRLAWFLAAATATFAALTLALLILSKSAE